MVLSSEYEAKPRSEGLTVVFGQELDPVDVAGMVSELEGLLGGLEIPKVDHSIGASRNEHAATVREPSARDPVRVA